MEHVSFDDEEMGELELMEPETTEKGFIKLLKKFERVNSIDTEEELEIIQSQNYKRYFNFQRYVQQSIGEGKPLDRISSKGREYLRDSMISDLIGKIKYYFTPIFLPPEEDTKRIPKNN